jgi:putative transcriptional regulator
MQPRHHPTEELLLDYVVSGDSQAESLMIAAHLAYCSKCRRAAEDLAGIGGALLDALPPRRLPPNMLNRTLAAIERDVIHAAPQLPPGNPPRYTMAGRWRRVPGGYAMARVATDDDAGRIWLLKAQGGKGLLRHRHVGDEWTVVVQGAFADETGFYATGDFVSLDDGFEHRPVALPGQDCICLIMVRETPRYSGIVGRLAAPFLRL